MAMKMRNPNAMGNASHALSVHASAISKTTVLKANLMAQLKINFQFITTTKVQRSEQSSKYFVTFPTEG
jgi:hypothetical protein